VVRPDKITLKDVEAAINVLRAYIIYYRRAIRVLREISALQSKASGKENLEAQILRMMLQNRVKEEEEEEELLSEEELDESLERLRRIAEEDKRKFEEERKKGST